MAEETQLIPLNFNDGIIGKTLNDRKVGVDIIFGFVSGMPPGLAEIAEAHNDLAIALMDRGIGQQELDHACQQLAGELLNAEYEILIAKSDLPFDSRWYLIGNIRSLIAAAKTDDVTLPFSNLMCDDIINHLDTYG